MISPISVMIDNDDDNDNDDNLYDDYDDGELSATTRSMSKSVRPL